MNLERAVQQVLENMSFSQGNLVSVFNKRSKSIVDELERQVSDISETQLLTIDIDTVDSASQVDDRINQIRSHLRGTENAILYFHTADSGTPAYDFSWELIRVGKEVGRVGGLPGISASELVTVLADERSQKFSNELHAYLQDVSSIYVSDARGTHLYVEFDHQEFTLVNSNGIVAPYSFGNPIPAEVFAFPKLVEGIAVVNGSYFNLHDSYATWHIENSQIVEVESEDAKLLDSMSDYIFEQDPNGSRIGEWGWPANLAVLDVKNGFGLIVTEKSNVHIAHGDGYSSRTGCPYTCDVHCDALFDAPTIIDTATDVIIMDRGEYNTQLFPSLRT